jgi:UDP:flavonoid glycosyltransferase YjiC (YdhE family)
MLALAHGLTGAGHDVAFATAADFCAHIEVTGFDAFPAGLPLARQMAEARTQYPEQDALSAMERFEQFVPRMLGGVAAPARAADLLPLVERWRPDLLVHDETEFAGPVAAATLGIPWADQSVGILRPPAMARLAGQVLAPVYERYGVEVGAFGGLYRYLYIDVAPPSLQSPEIADIDVAHSVQNATIEPGAEGDALPAWVHDLPADRPVVYVSLGTVFNARAGDVFAAVLEALRSEPVTAIVTIGSDNDPAAFGAQPEHIHIERFIPQSLLLPFCDAVVNQGGTAILPILAHGLPLLVLPQGANQFHNAQACVAAGVGRRLLPGEVTAEAVRRDVLALLHDRALRDAARRVQGELAAMPGPERGVELLEQLAAERRPLTRT